MKDFIVYFENGSFTTVKAISWVRDYLSTNSSYIFYGDEEKPVAYLSKVKNVV